MIISFHVNSNAFLEIHFNTESIIFKRKMKNQSSPSPYVININSIT